MDIIYGFEEPAIADRNVAAAHAWRIRTQSRRAGYNIAVRVGSRCPKSELAQRLLHEVHSPT
ncbi:MAG: hypothetical protein NVS2B17_28450 [Candidatus Velthaea sp.]